jgi:hypothetical protein
MPGKRISGENRGFLIGIITGEVTAMRLAIFVLTVALALAGNATTQEAAFPRIVEHAHAVYPAIAMTAHIQGDVMVKFTTDGRSVVSAEAASGPDLLQKACVDNVKTWKFAHHTPGTFQAIFRFKLLDQGFEDIFPGPPNLIEIIAVPPTIETDSSDGKTKN